MMLVNLASLPVSLNPKWAQAGKWGTSSARGARDGGQGKAPLYLAGLTRRRVTTPPATARTQWATGSPSESVASSLRLRGLRRLGLGPGPPVAVFFSDFFPRRPTSSCGRAAGAI
jgi:hypothetical protein